MINKTTSKNILVSDIIAFVLAGFYLQSVLTVAHHAAMRVHNGSVHAVESPAVVLLVIGLILCAYSCYKQRSFSKLIVIALTVFASASLFWLSGLRANFFF